MKQRRLTQFLLSVSAAILVTTTPIWADNSIDDPWPEDDMWSEDDPWPEDDLWGNLVRGGFYS